MVLSMARFLACWISCNAAARVRWDGGSAASARWFVDCTL